MDAIEIARQAAAAFHDKAVEAGRDPRLPYQFAIAEAKRREIDVEPTVPGAAILENGRAVFIPAEQLIVHENKGTAFEQAFLVAHEIGHAELGDDPDTDQPVEIDPARSAEPSPVGVDRVVDYGRKQRREVQMDLFAREFLLPRHVVRKLHLEDKLTASAIAEQFGAPFDIVAQQLFDALLLPPIALKEKANNGARPLNPLQDAAANHRGAAYLLEAGPGTGKTQTLTTRVDGLLAEGVDPRRILVLTFSNKAASEMAERIASKRKEAAAAMWIGTFHAFGLDLLRRFHADLGLPKDPRMMDKSEAVELLEEEYPRLELVHYRNLYDPTQNIVDILAAISRAKDEVVDAAKYKQLAQAMLTGAKTPEEREAAERVMEVAQVYELYESLKRKSNCVDFGDLVLLPVKLLEEIPAVCAALRAKYDHVLVDEYQDVNRSSVRLISALCGDGKNLWVVGDAKQSIYRFRGASSFNMVRFGNQDFKGGSRGRLKLNYRSVAEIVETFSEFSVGMKAGGSDSGLQSHRGIGTHKPELRTVGQTDDQTVVLSDTINEMQKLGYRFRDQAVLCTGNEKLSTIGQNLERLGVPVLFLGSLFERTEIKDLFAFLTILTDRRAPGLMRLACLPECKMSMPDVAIVLESLRSQGKTSPGKWLQDIDAFKSVSTEGKKSLINIATILKGFDQTAAPWEVLATVLLDRTRIAAGIATSTNVVEQTRGIAIWQLMNFVRVQRGGKGLPINRLLERVRRLVRLGDDRDLRQLPTAAQGIDAVRLMTIHGAKGLEFSVVHIPGLNADTIPRNPVPPPCLPPEGMVEGGQGGALEVFRTGHAEEQECLFYVALSRAKERLFIYAPTQKTNGHNRQLSPFLGRVGPNLIRKDVIPTRPLSDAEAEIIPLSVDGPLRFTNQQIALYESCSRRFFYTHVLQLGGRRNMTAFMQMHEAIRSVFKGIIAGDAVESDEQLETKIADALRAHGLADHGYASHYNSFARTMLRYFLSLRKGQISEPPTALRLMIGTEEIIVNPDDVVVRPDGVRAFRRIETRHERTADSENVGAAAFILAAQRAFPGSIAELVYLSDQKSEQLTLTPRQLQGRSDKLTKFLKNIRQGQFPAETSVRTCPNCPAFFVCGPTPSGTLQKKF